MRVIRLGAKEQQEWISHSCYLIWAILSKSAKSERAKERIPNPGGVRATEVGSQIFSSQQPPSHRRLCRTLWVVASTARLNFSADDPWGLPSPSTTDYLYISNLCQAPTKTIPLHVSLLTLLHCLELTVIATSLPAIAGIPRISDCSCEAEEVSSLFVYSLCWRSPILVRLG